MSTMTPQLREQRKTALLNAALREFMEYGYEQASTSRTVKEAGLSKPLMFRYVGNKQQLFLFVYEYFFDLFNEEYYRQLDCTEPSVIKRLHGAYRLQLHLPYVYPWVFDFFKIYAGMDIRIFDEDLRQRLKKCRTKDCTDLFKQYGHSLFISQPEETACMQVLYCSCKGFGDLMLDKVGTMQREELSFSSVEEDLHVFFEGLRRLMYKDSTTEAPHTCNEQVDSYALSVNQRMEYVQHTGKPHPQS